MIGLPYRQFYCTEDPMLRVSKFDGDSRNEICCVKLFYFIYS